MGQNVCAHVWLQVNVFLRLCAWSCVHFSFQCWCEREREWRGVCLGVNVSGENECLGAGPCASAPAVYVIVFWLGLSGVPSSGLVEILARPTSPLLSQFDSWWDLRWNVRVGIAGNIHNNLISLFHASPLFPTSFSLPFHSSTSSLFIHSHCSLSFPSFCLTKHLSHTSHTIHRVQGRWQPPASWAVVFHVDGSVLSLRHKSSDPQ